MLDSVNKNDSSSESSSDESDNPEFIESDSDDVQDG